MMATSIIVTHPNRCDDYLTANGLTFRMDKTGALRVWSEGGFRMAVYEAGDWLSVTPVQPSPKGSDHE